MKTFFSKVHNLYVSQFSKNGTLYTGRGSTPDLAIMFCYKSVLEYAPYDK